ncbi:MAG TPA: pitrilysin family protein, partial [Longimicrobiaceae bacterium]|nr:pitrilysin family protein [Longimicrobiaceae bacterium]
MSAAFEGAAPRGGAPDRARVPPAGPLRPFHFPAVHRRVLSSGLVVLVAEVRNFPVVTVDLLLPAGALHEPGERAGLAMLTAGLLESGAGDRGPDEIAEAVDSLGLSLDSGSSWDTTQVGFTCLRSRLDAACAILSDLVRRPTFPADEVDRIRDERLAALLHRRNDPSSIANEVLNRYVFAPESPYARPLGGTSDTVGEIGRADVEAFHAARYQPRGAA